MVFYPGLERNEVSIMDSTAVTTAMQCWRKYFYRMVIGYRGKEKPPYFAFGSAYHLFRELLERGYMEDPSPSKWSMYLVNALEQSAEYCDKHLVTPTEGKWVFMNKQRLLESCKVAYDWWKKEKIAGVIKVIAVEQAFLMDLPDGTVMAGRADQIIQVRGVLWGRDFKTSSQHGKYFVNTLSPNEQFSGYTFAENMLQGYDFSSNSRPKVEGQYIEALFNSKTTKPTIENYLATRTKSQLVTWLRERQMWHLLLKTCRENDIWPMNPKSCTFCEYRSVCDLGNESQQQAYLKSNYIYDPWDCTKSEGDGDGV